MDLKKVHSASFSVHVSQIISKHFSSTFLYALVLVMFR